jgi:opacity protein-like surface antigen
MSGKILGGLLLVLLVSATYAQEMKDPFSIGPHLGYYKASDADKGSVMSGATLRLWLANEVCLEASINYRREYYNNEAITLKSWPLLITGLFYPVKYVYGMVGMGWYNTRIAYSKELSLFGDKSLQKFGWHLGAGVETPLSRKIKVATDFRYTFLNYDFGAVPGTSNISSDYFIISAGIFFSL